MKKFTNKQAVKFLNAARDQSPYMSSVMQHELQHSGAVFVANPRSTELVIESNKETADFLRAIADALESEE